MPYYAICNFYGIVLRCVDIFLLCVFMICLGFQLFLDFDHTKAMIGSDDAHIATEYRCALRRFTWPRDALQPVPVERSPIWDHPEVWDMGKSSAETMVCPMKNGRNSCKCDLKPIQ